MNGDNPIKNDKKVKTPLRIAEFLSAFIFISIFVFMFVFSLFFSRTERSIYDEKLSERPQFTLDAYFSGAYTDGLDKYLTDTIHNRDEFKSTASKIRYYFGIEQDEYNFGDDPFFGESSFEFPPASSEPPMSEEPESSNESSQSDVSIDNSEEPNSSDISETVSSPVSEPVSEEPNSSNEASDVISSVQSEEPSPEPSEEPSIPDESSEPDDDIDEKVFGLISVIGKGKNIRALEVFPGLEYLDKTCVSYAQRIDAFADAVGSNVKVYSMVVPKSCAFYLSASKKYGHMWKNSLDVDTRIKELMKKAIYVDAYHVLEAHKDEEIYARTDFHWTGLGAFYAGEEFAKMAGVNYAPISEYTINRRSGYYGNMYNSTNHFAPLKDNPEDLITMVPTASYKAYYHNVKYQYKESYTKNVKYSVFVPIADSYVTGWYETHIGGDLNFVRIETGLKTGRKLFIIKDSYGDALAPLFMSSFDEIYIADLRYMEVNALNFIKEHGITDVLFGISSNTACTSLNKHIERIMK